MYIREIQPSDNARMEQIIKKSLESVGLNIPGTAYTDPQLGDLTSFYENLPSSAYWVAVDASDTVMGGVGIGTFVGYPHVCELQKLYVAEEFRGRGVSKELMKTALQFASTHFLTCYLETSSTLLVANMLYEKFGFRKMDAPLLGSEHGAMDVWYMKELHSDEGTDLKHETNKNTLH